jgi:carbonic anhydrase
VIVLLIREILAANKGFLRHLDGAGQQGTGQLGVGARPAKKLAVFSCMDTRLVELLERSLGLRRGDAKIIKNAGTVYSEDVVRSLVAAVFTLGVEEVLVVVHLDCGIAKVSGSELKERMLDRGIKEEDLAGVDLDAWMGTFQDYHAHVRDVVNRIRAHPFIPTDLPVHGVLFCPETGEVELIVNGYEGFGG